MIEDFYDLMIKNNQIELTDKLKLIYWKEYKKTGNVKYRNKLVQSILKLIIKNVNGAKKYNKVSFDDLFSRAIEFTLRAIETWKPEKGKFSTHVVKAVKFGFIYYNPYEIIHHPRYTVDQIEKLFRLGFSIDDIRRMDVESINKYLLRPQGHLVKDAINSYGITKIEDLQNSTDDSVDNFLFTQKSTTESLEKPSYSKEIEFLLNTLSEKEKEIIKRRFGFNGYKVHKHKELAKLFKVSKQRIHQLEKKSLSKLSQMEGIKCLFPEGCSVSKF